MEKSRRRTRQGKEQVKINKEDKGMREIRRIRIKQIKRRKGIRKEGEKRLQNKEEQVMRNRNTGIRAR